MKKVLAILLVLTMVFSFAACGSKEDVSSDTGTSSNITSTEGDESSSETTNNESTGDAITSDTISDSSSEQNTSKPTESSKPADTSKPTTSTTSKPAETHTHTWGNWIIEKEPIIGRDGIEKRICSTCEEVEKRGTNKDAALYSFNIGGGEGWIFDNYESEYNVNILSSANLLDVIGATYEGPERADDSFSISYSGAIEFLSINYNITDVLKASLKQNPRYNSATDKFDLRYPGSPTELAQKGYVHNGGNSYSVFFHTYDYDYKVAACWKVDIEYNLIDNKPNKCISVMRVESIPSNITK